MLFGNWEWMLPALERELMVAARVLGTGVAL
jgi:hypothetical protein